MKRLIFVAAVLTAVLAVGVFAENDSEQVLVQFKIDEYLDLKVSKGKTVNFGKVDPEQRQKTLRDATVLKVESNTSWKIEASTKVLNKPNQAQNREVRDMLNTRIRPAQGFGDRDDISVDYTLSNLDEVPAGQYALQVTYTATTR